MPLPSPITFLSSLFPPISSSNPSSSNPPSNSNVPFNPPTKSLLLTLHCLFPTELLPALDLLDRHLVTRFVLQSSISADDPDNPAEEEGGGTDRRTAVYYVRSSQHLHRRYRGLEAGTHHYEMRLKAWNCTCPAFVFAAFGPEDEGVARGHEEGKDGDEQGRGDSVNGGHDKFGGLILGKREVPVCKHLLACLLAEKGEGFEGFVEERIVGREEMAGWAAGWGG